jgi:integrase
VRRKSLVTERPGRDGWYCNFSVGGRRFRDRLAADTREEAEALAAANFAAAKAGRSRAPDAPAATQFTLGQALGRYWETRGAHVRSADDIRRHSQTLIAELGNETLLSRLGTRDMEDYVARRRVRKARNKETGKIELRDRANASINREIGLLRSVLIAAKHWHVAVPEIAWRRVMLPEPDKAQTILSPAKEADLFEALRPDYWPLIEFALISGVRLENAIGLRWDQIDWQGRTITFRVKSRRPGGKLLALPLTDGLALLLAREQGRHPDLVFTYVCRRNRHDPHSGLVQNKGERYGFSHDGWRKEWMAARDAIGLPGLRFHDLRHTAATRTLAACGNLNIVKEMLGHADIATTARYANSDSAQVRAAMEAVQQPRPLRRLNRRDGGLSEPTR